MIGRASQTCYYMLLAIYGITFMTMCVLHTKYVTVNRRATRSECTLNKLVAFQFFAPLPNIAQFFYNKYKHATFDTLHKCIFKQSRTHRMPSCATEPPAMRVLHSIHHTSTFSLTRCNTCYIWVCTFSFFLFFFVLSTVDIVDLFGASECASSGSPF